MVIKKRSRPKLVWLVFLYYLVRITVGAGGLLLVLHTASVSPHARAAVEGLTSLGWVLTGLILALRLSGAFSLFALRRSALPLFVAGMCLSIVHALTHLTSFLTQPSRSSSLTLVIGWTINLSVCLYVYASPNFGGVTASLEFAPGGVAGQAQGGTRESAVLQYDNYGLKLGAAYYNGHDTNPTPTSVATGLNNNRFYYAGALYTINGFSFSTSFSNGRNPAHSKTTNFDMISGGFGYRFTPAFELTSGVYYIKDENNSANKSTEFVLGTDYSLSKSTTLYAQVGYVDNKGKMNQSIEYGQPVAPGVDTTAAMIGIRKRF